MAEGNFDEITERLDEIIAQVRSKDTSLERSLDLLDEAIALGSKAVEIVDKPEFTPEEEARLKGAAEASDGAGSDGAAAADGGDETGEPAADGDAAASAEAEGER